MGCHLLSCHAVTFLAPLNLFKYEGEVALEISGSDSVPMNR